KVARAIFQSMMSRPILITLMVANSATTVIEGISTLATTAATPESTMRMISWVDLEVRSTQEADMEERNRVCPIATSCCENVWVEMRMVCRFNRHMRLMSDTTVQYRSICSSKVF